MRILDLFCGAGGAAMGYHRVFPGAEIIGVDITPQPNYPFEFWQADAMEFPVDGFDLIHASPPCLDHSTARTTGPKHGTGWMLHATIRRLQQSGVTWIVENVEGAVMPSDVYSFKLCGSSFGLDVRRHRKFATNTLVLAPGCDHAWQTPRFQSLNNDMRLAGQLAAVVGVHGHINYVGEHAIRCKAMGIDWMTSAELAQALPPAFTRYIGQQLAQQLSHSSSGPAAPTAG